MTKEFRPPSFDLRLAMDALAAMDPQLALLIKETEEFRIETDGSDSPYEILLEAIAYQSISGKAAATIFGRVKALGANGRAPTPDEMLRLRKSALRKAGLSGAKTLRRGTRPTPGLRSRHRGLDRRNVLDFAPRPAGRSPNPRPQRQKRPG